MKKQLLLAAMLALMPVLPAQAELRFLDPFMGYSPVMSELGCLGDLNEVSDAANLLDKIHRPNLVVAITKPKDIRDIGLTRKQTAIVVYCTKGSEGLSATEEIGLTPVRVTLKQKIRNGKMNFFIYHVTPA